MSAKVRTTTSTPDDVSLFYLCSLCHNIWTVTFPSVGTELIKAECCISSYQWSCQKDIYTYMQKFIDKSLFKKNSREICKNGRYSVAMSKQLFPQNVFEIERCPCERFYVSEDVWKATKLPVYPVLVVSLLLQKALLSFQHKN